MPPCTSCGDQAAAVHVPCDDCLGRRAESSAALVLALFLTVLALGVLVALYGGLMMMIGFWPFVLLLVAGAAIKILIQQQ
jgi:hypothetical protein